MAMRLIGFNLLKLKTSKEISVQTSVMKSSKKLSFKSFESAYKVLVLWMPEYLGKEGNKLLKLIEEPPDNTIFILVAASEEIFYPPF